MSHRLFISHALRQPARRSASGLSTLLLGAMAAGCVVQGSPAPLKGGDGVDINSASGTVSLDPGKVPVVPTCTDGQIVGMGKNGWECFTPAQPIILQAGDGISIENNIVSAQFGSTHTDVAYGDHNHDDRYRQLSQKITWNDVDPSTIPMTTDWPGQVPYSQVTGAPDVAWPTIQSTVQPTDNWPGMVPFAQISGVPSVWPGTVPFAQISGVPSVWPGTVPYSQVTGAPSVNWSTVSATVTSNTAWPGTVPYAQVTGAPSVNWSTVKSSVLPTDNWPGEIPYAQVTGAPPVTWSTVSGTVTSSNAWPGTVPYTQVTGAPPVTWGTVKSSVSPTDTWPGAIPYAQVTGAPSVTWSTVQPSVTSSTPWPGTVPYTSVTGAPQVNWTTVSPTVPAGAIPNSMLGASSVTVSPQSPLTGGGLVSLGGSVSVGLGTVPVSKGGTNATSFAAGGVVVANSSGNTLTSVAPGPNGTVLTSNGSTWSAQPVSTAGLAGVTTGAVNLYVNPAGDDTRCNGTADAAYSTSVQPNCAFASPQHAVDSLPQVLVNAVTVQIDAGTYYTPSGATTVLELRKTSQRAGGTLTLAGPSPSSGSNVVTFSGLTASGSSTKAASVGILIASPSSPSLAAAVSIQNITVSDVSQHGVDVETSKVTLQNVAVANAGSVGILCQAASYCQLTGTTNVTASDLGIYARFGSWIDAATTNVSGSTSTGITVDGGSTFTASGAVTSNNNGGPGLFVSQGGKVQLNALGTFSGNTGSSPQLFTKSSAAVMVANGSSFVATQGLNITTAGQSIGLSVDRNSTAGLAAGANINITCGTAGGSGIDVDHSGSVQTTGASAITISTCANSVVLGHQSSFEDDGSGMRTASGAITLDGYSTYTAGGFPSCMLSAYGECK